MLYFWFFTAVLLFVVVSYMALTEGFKKWGFYYIFAFLALFAYITRKWMMKRMEKHVKYMEEKQASSEE
jgi:type VI protein secretion system component VasK